MNTAYVTDSVANGIATLTFYHPQSNSMPGSLLDELVRKIEQAGEDKSVKVIVLKSAGDGAFCAGASFDELVAIADAAAGKKFFMGFASVMNAIRTVPKFVIARVQGKCVGGALGFVAAADYAIALETASVKLSELSIGIGPFVIGPAVERKIGLSAFSQLTINATQWKSAQWALEKGLYMDVYSTKGALDKAVEDLAGKLAEASAESMYELKKLFWEGTQHWEQLLPERAEVVGKLALSEFSKKAVGKLKNK